MLVMILAYTHIYTHTSRYIQVSSGSSPYKHIQRRRINNLAFEVSYKNCAVYCTKCVIFWWPQRSWVPITKHPIKRNQRGHWEFVHIHWRWEYCVITLALTTNFFNAFSICPFLLLVSFPYCCDFFPCILPLSSGVMDCQSIAAQICLHKIGNGFLHVWVQYMTILL